MSKWGELIKYLNSVDAKPAAVLKMVKAAYGKKGRVSPTRVAWKLNVIVSIMNRTDKSTDAKIYGLVDKKIKFIDLHIIVFTQINIQIRQSNNTTMPARRYGMIIKL